MVVFNFEVVAVERFGFNADADYGLPVAAVVNQFVPGFEVGSIEPSRRWRCRRDTVCPVRVPAGWGLRRIGQSTGVCCPRRWFAVCRFGRRQQGMRYPGRCC